MVIAAGTTLFDKRPDTKPTAWPGAPIDESGPNQIDRCLEAPEPTANRLLAWSHSRGRPRLCIRSGAMVVDEAAKRRQD
jgi:hypothetical protein